MSSIEIFRVALGGALLWKFTLDTWQAGGRRLAPGGFARRYLDAHHRRLVPLVPVLRVLAVARFPGALAVVTGHGTWIGLAVCSGWLAGELAYDFRYHTVYLALCCLFLLPAGAGLDDPGWSMVMITLLTAQMYLNSAYLKLRSRQFRSGLVLSQFFAFSADVDDLLPWPEFLGPTRLRRRLGAPGLLPRWHALSSVVIVLEAALPGALVLSGRSAPVAAVVLGVAAVMHLGFTALLPLRLVPFTTVTLAALLLFPAGATVLRGGLL